MEKPYGEVRRINRDMARSSDPLSAIRRSSTMLSLVGDLPRAPITTSRPYEQRRSLAIRLESEICGLVSLLG